MTVIAIAHEENLGKKVTDIYIEHTKLLVQTIYENHWSTTDQHTSPNKQNVKRLLLVADKQNARKEYSEKKDICT